jgi:hypothetical protein
MFQKFERETCASKNFEFIYGTKGFKSLYYRTVGETSTMWFNGLVVWYCNMASWNVYTMMHGIYWLMNTTTIS